MQVFVNYTSLNSTTATRKHTCYKLSFQKLFFLYIIKEYIKCVVFYSSKCIKCYIKNPTLAQLVEWKTLVEAKKSLVHLFESGRSEFICSCFFYFYFRVDGCYAYETNISITICCMFIVVDRSDLRFC